MPMSYCKLLKRDSVHLKRDRYCILFILCVFSKNIVQVCDTIFTVTIRLFADIVV